MNETVLQITEQVLPTSEESVGNGGEIAILLPIAAVSGEEVETLVGSVFTISTYNEFTSKFSERSDIGTENKSYEYAGYLLRRGCTVVIVPYVYVAGGTNIAAAITLLANPEIEFSLILGYGIEYPTATEAATKFVNLLAIRKNVIFITEASDSDISAETPMSHTGLDEDNTSVEVSSYELLAHNGTYINDIIIGGGANTLIPNCVVYAELVAKLHQNALYYKEPAGLSNGLLEDVVDLTKVLSPAQIKTDQTYGVNPIVNKVSVGPVVWGNNLYSARQGLLTDSSSVITEVSVRVLVNWLKRRVYAISQKFMFEADDETTWNQWKNAVDPVIRSIYDAKGLRKYKVIMDSTLMSDDDINNGILRGQIIIWPLHSITKIYITFAIDKTGVSFE